jgi:CubicO group peptidase (beta-lactamase class C family)
MPRDLGGLLANVVGRDRVPGLAALVLHDGQVVGEGVAGVRRLGTAQQIRIDDRFLLASGTKPMAATLAAIGVEAGQITWETTLPDALPEMAARMNAAWRRVTLVQLLRHRAGVPRDASRLCTLLRTQLLSRAPVVEKRRRLVAAMLSHRPQYPPGSQFVYTSLDYLIVAVMLEKAMGQPWEDLVRERLWNPLGIATGGFGSPGTPGKVDQPWGHLVVRMPWHSSGPGGFWANLLAARFYAPAGSVNMAIGDWAKFVELHLRGDPANPHHREALLQSGTFAFLHRAGAPSLYESGWFLGNHGWASGGRPGDVGRVLRSLGDNGLWHSDALLAPEIDFAVLILCNQGGAQDGKPAARASRDAAAAIIQEFLGGAKTRPGNLGQTANDGSAGRLTGGASSDSPGSARLSGN